MARKMVCILSFSTIVQDARVLRQIEYLSSHYDITVVGHGPAPAGVKYIEVPAFTTVSKLLAVVWLLLGKLAPRAYEAWYWSTRRHRAAYQAMMATKPDAIHANDWNALPVAVRVAEKTGARVVFDAHEYAPLQFGNRRLRVFLYTPAIRYMLGKYTRRADAAMTVCAPIAERYRDEFGLSMMVVMNAPALSGEKPQERKINPEQIRLIHHGGALRDRNLGLMIEAIAQAGKRFHLDFMLLPTDPAYLDELKRLAEERAPGRVAFVDPVPPAQIVQTLQKYDIGFGVIDATNYNYLMALPNKLFDFVAAGLAVVTGPSPAMVALIEEYDFGVASPTFDPRDIAGTLNSLTVERIAEMQKAAREAAKVLNADTEMAKVVDLYARLLGEVY